MLGQGQAVFFLSHGGEANESPQPAQLVGGSCIFRKGEAYFFFALIAACAAASLAMGTRKGLHET